MPDPPFLVIRLDLEAAARGLEQATGPRGYVVTDELWQRYREVTPEKVARLYSWAAAAVAAALAETREVKEEELCGGCFEPRTSHSRKTMGHYEPRHRYVTNWEEVAE